MNTLGDGSPIVFTPVRDVAPDTTTDEVEFPCEVCGRESGPYGGRGRKPKRCPEHKKTAGTGVGRGTTPRNNAVLAGQAADALVQLNGIVALVGNLAGYGASAEALQLAQDGFREQAYAALLTDQELCRTILKGGVMSGRVSLLIAYGMMAGAVAPVALFEAREKAAQRKALQEA